MSRPTPTVSESQATSVKARKVIHCGMTTSPLAIGPGQHLLKSAVPAPGRSLGRHRLHPRGVSAWQGEQAGCRRRRRLVGGRLVRVDRWRPLPNLAYIRRDGSVDRSFCPRPQGDVRALAMAGSRLYVSGWFERIAGAACYHVAALDAGAARRLDSASRTPPHRSSSSWSVPRRCTHGEVILLRSRRLRSDERETVAVCAARALRWISNAGLYWDRLEDVEGELFGTSPAGPLSAYAGDPALRQLVERHWREERPPGRAGRGRERAVPGGGGGGSSGAGRRASPASEL
jgi:hypothetical protein